MPVETFERLDEEHIREVFANLDSNNEGWVSKMEIHRCLILLGLPVSVSHVNRILSSAENDQDMKITYPEFLSFVRGRENELHHVYLQIKPDTDEQVTAIKLAQSLLKLDVVKDMHEALKISSDIFSFVSERRDKEFSFLEFKKLLLLMPEVDAQIMFDYWAKASKIDLGENYVVPDDHTREKSRLNIFLSGAIAGIFSRSLTAPLDRLKIIMQAGKGDQSIVNGLKHMYSEGGLVGFWRGNFINCVKIAPESAAKFLW